jgi:hypothetical protein
VQVGQRSGLIDRGGKFVVNPPYDFIFGVSEGYAIFATGKGSVPGCPRYCANYGFIDTKGQVLVDAKFVEHPNPDGSYSSPVRPFSELVSSTNRVQG